MHDENFHNIQKEMMMRVINLFVIYVHFVISQYASKTKFGYRLHTRILLWCMRVWVRVCKTLLAL